MIAEDNITIDKKHLEALLFVAKEPLTLHDIQKRLCTDEEKIEEDIILRWLYELKREYEDRGFRIRQVAGGFEMVSAPECHLIIEKVVPKEYETLSRAQLHTLTVIAYNQHINRAGIAKLRGVKNPDESIQRLIDRGLVSFSEEGYVTTEEFLKFFGINDLKELPPIERTEGTPKDSISKDDALIEDNEIQDIDLNNEEEQI
ncbi:SMC-Scp complex subunit ScpB [Priestia megaterium]|nr:SMC-Scp complex subunit ScpB [Priestia megaterium]